LTDIRPCGIAWTRPDPRGVRVNTQGGKSVREERRYRISGTCIAFFGSLDGLTPSASQQASRPVRHDCSPAGAHAMMRGPTPVHTNVHMMHSDTVAPVRVADNVRQSAV